MPPLQKISQQIQNTLWRKFPVLPGCFPGKGGIFSTKDSFSGHKLT